MTLFYDPQKRKPKIWAILFFLLVPVLLIVLLFIGTQGLVEKNKQQKQPVEIQ